MNTPIFYGERGEPPYFAGRNEELKRLDERLQNTLRGGPKSAKEGLMLIAGVPGVGKTQLALEFARRAEAEHGKRLKTLRVGTNRLRDTVGLFRAIGAKQGDAKAFDKAAGLAPLRTGRQGGVPGVLQIGGTKDVHRHIPGLETMLAGTADRSVWRKHALLIVVDEVQNADADALENLRVLHEGDHGCPIFPIVAGLQHSRDVLASGGISRTTGMRLDILTPGETRVAIAKGLTALDIAIGDDATEALARGSMRFPQHVHGHIAAAREVFKERGEVATEESIAEALRRGAEARARYYEERLDAMQDSPRLYPLVARMAAENLDVVTRSKALIDVDEDVLNDAIKHGVLTKHVGKLSVGVPSFRSYIEDEARSCGFDVPPRPSPTLPRELGAGAKERCRP